MRRSNICLDFGEHVAHRALPGCHNAALLSLEFWHSHFFDSLHIEYSVQNKPPLNRKVMFVQRVSVFGRLSGSLCCWWLSHVFHQEYMYLPKRASFCWVSLITRGHGLLLSLTIILLWWGGELSIESAEEVTSSKSESSICSGLRKFACCGFTKGMLRIQIFRRKAHSGSMSRTAEIHGWG